MITRFFRSRFARNREFGIFEPQPFEVRARLIDKLEIRVPSQTPMCGVFAEVYESLRRPWDGEKVEGVKPGKHYQHVLDGRLYGVDALLHLAHRASGDHKFEIIETGDKPWSRVLNEIEQVWHGDPRDHEVMRIDPAVDVRGTTVGWFFRHGRVEFKRKNFQYGKLEIDHSIIASCGVETNQFGKKPNCIRVYNKTRERQARMLRELRLHVDMSELDGLKPEWGGLMASDVDAFQHGGKGHGQRKKLVAQTDRLFFENEFQRRFGHDCYEIITRVERQVTGRRVPAELTTVRDIKANLGASALGNWGAKHQPFNPFETLRLVAGGDSLNMAPRNLGDGIVARSWPFKNKDTLMGFGLAALVEQVGYDEAYRQVSKLSKGNGKRIFARLQPFLSLLDEAGAEEKGISERDLFERFQESVSRQLAA